MHPDLPPERLEQRLPDAKPLYSAAEAKAEADRCLYCTQAPCIQACPTEIDVPTFIRRIASGNVRGAARTIFEQNMLGSSCARACPVEVLCVGACVYNGWERPPIQIGRLQRYATEVATRAGEPPLFAPPIAAGKTVAIVGGGPASLACAAELRLAGHRPEIFERKSFAGGLNTSGVAPYKLQSDDALGEVDWILELGIPIRKEVEIGLDLSGEQLLGRYDAVFLGVGMGGDDRLGIPGERGQGVIGATWWIETLKLEPASRTPSTLGRVVVIGGGNTALDAAREAALLGAEDVTLVYRRRLEDMTGYAHELAACREAGVRLLTEVVPIAFLRGPSGKLHGLRLARAENGGPVSDTDHDMPCDLVVVAIGQQNKLGAVAAQFPGVASDARGLVVADPRTGATGNPRVFAGGDCANGGKEVVHAVADGRNAAREMIRLWGET